MPGIGSDPCPHGAAVALGRYSGPWRSQREPRGLCTMSRPGYKGPGETMSWIDAGGLGHQSVGSQPAGVGEENSDNSLVFLCVLPLGRNPAFCSWSRKFLGAQG
jgi:hypothetical protein